MADDPDQGGKRRGRLFTGVVLTALGLAAVGVATLSAQTRPGLQSPHPRLLAPLPIDWAAVADDYDPDRAESLKHLDGFELHHTDFDRTTLPILMPGPASGISTRNMTFSSVGDAYGMALPQDQLDSDVTIVITATRVAVDADPGTFEAKDFETLNVGGRRTKALVEPTESGWTASFKRYGAIYSVDVDCGNTGAGSPCADAGYIRRVTTSLSDIALGRRAEGSLPGNPNLRHVPGHSADWDRAAQFPRNSAKDWDRTNSRRGSDAWGPIDNHSPMAGDDEKVTIRNGTAIFEPGALLQNDRDPDGDALKITGVSNAVNGSATYDGRVVRFVPKTGFTGDARFDYTIVDEKNKSDTGTVWIQVTPPVAPSPTKQCVDAAGRATDCTTQGAGGKRPVTPPRPNTSASDQVVK